MTTYNNVMQAKHEKAIEDNAPAFALSAALTKEAKTARKQAKDMTLPLQVRLDLISKAQGLESKARAAYNRATLAVSFAMAI